MGSNDTYNNGDWTPRDYDEPQPTNDATALALIEEQADRTIRRVWHDERWYFSVVDVIAVLTDSPRGSFNSAELVHKRSPSLAASEGGEGGLLDPL